MRTDMLHEFIVSHGDDIVRRWHAPITTASTAPPTDAEIDRWLRRFLDHLVDALRSGAAMSDEMKATAIVHGRARWLEGCTVSQVVQDYGDVSHAITGVAVEWDVSIRTEEVRILCRCLADAIAAGVTEYERGQQGVGRDDHAARDRVRLESFAHDVRNLTTAAMLAFDMLKINHVGVMGRHGALVELSLTRICDLLERSLAVPSAPP